MFETGAWSRMLSKTTHVLVKDKANTYGGMEGVGVMLLRKTPLSWLRNDKWICLCCLQSLEPLKGRQMRGREGREIAGGSSRENSKIQKLPKQQLVGEGSTLLGVNIQWGDVVSRRGQGHTLVGYYPGKKQKCPNQECLVNLRLRASPKFVSSEVCCFIWTKPIKYVMEIVNFAFPNRHVLIYVNCLGEPSGVQRGSA